MAITDFIKTNSINLPLLGGASLGVLVAGGILLYLLSTRKKSISLRV